MNPPLQHGLPDAGPTDATGIKTNCWVSVVLLGLLLLCYANSFQASWQYDDFPNIVDNPKIRMTALSLSQIRRGLSAGWSYQTISRPLAYLSFALNYRWGEYHVRGYHVVNFTIHWLAGIFLFLFVQRLLKLPLFQGRYDPFATVVAALAAAFWATHPIQVTAVTYIVQRMTSMAGLFYIACLYLYLVGRTSAQRATRATALAGCVASAVAAMLTKENSVLLIYALFLLDRLFLHPTENRNWTRSLIWIVVLTAVIGLLGMLYTDPRGLLRPFSNRPFSMAQRLMSQPRMLFDYLGMIIAPTTSHLSLLHDVPVSRSLFTPWTTLPALIGLLTVVTLLCLRIRKHPLFAFCGLFFFLNHLIESSFLNLEMFYEHRNYIPSMMLFVPLAVAAIKSMAFFQYRRALQVMIGATLLLLLAANMQTTFSYNRSLESEFSLWSHVVVRYPKASLGHSNLGKVYWSLGLFEESCRELRTAVELDRFNEQHQKGLAYYNLALCEAYKERNFALAMKHLSTARTYYDNYPKIALEFARCRTLMGDWSSAMEELDKALRRWPANPDLMGLQAILALKKGRYQKAIQTARRVIQEHPKDQIAWMVMAQALRLMDDVQQSLETWQKVNAMYPDDIIAIMALIEIQAEHGRVDQACRYKERFLKLKKYRTSLESIAFSRLNSAIVPYIPDDKFVKQAMEASCFQKNNNE